MTMSVVVVHCWSAPRSRSTALMYSFDARKDCSVLDEPLYREWLKCKTETETETETATATTVQRPYTRNLIDGIPPDGCEEADEVERWKRETLSFSERISMSIRSVIAASAKSAAEASSEEEGSEGSESRRLLIFCKHMAKHAPHYDFGRQIEMESIPNLPSAVRSVEHRHVLLIRDPFAIFSSWNQSVGAHSEIPPIDEIGIVHMMNIYSTLENHHLHRPAIILDSDEISVDPTATLTDLCRALETHFDSAMLTWKEGPRDCDGPWAKWWYSDVHQSTGWRPRPAMAPQARYRSIDTSFMGALRASEPIYQVLRRISRTSRSARLLGTTSVYEDPRNVDLLVWVGTPGEGRLVPRDVARISPWDSSVQGGDACWEGIRIYRGKIFSLDKHLGRLLSSAKALGFGMPPHLCHTKEEIVEAILRTLAANGMRDGAHMRLTLTRGEKSTSSMNPKFNIYGTTLIILPEWKPLVGGATTYDNDKGISLITASQRRNPPQCVDSKIHHNNMINNILPKIQANLVGAADAIMLDVEGYVSETNATNLFMVNEEGVLLTPHADHCLPGITRRTVLDAAIELGIPSMERRISLAEFHAAAEVFTTGTMGELTPVTVIDGRPIGSGWNGGNGGGAGPITKRLQALYQTLPEREGWSTRIPEFATEK